MEDGFDVVLFAGGKIQGYLIYNLDKSKNNLLIAAIPVLPFFSFIYTKIEL
jgi:hypothetical protein